MDLMVRIHVDTFNENAEPIEDIGLFISSPPTVTCLVIGKAHYFVEIQDLREALRLLALAAGS